MKKLLSFILAVIMIAGCLVPAFALSENDLDALKAEFTDGVGPEVNGWSLDYVSYSPVGENDTARYPLVIWLHGMAQGGSPRAQISDNNFAFWASEELQSRFKGTGGAFLLAVRSREENNQFWSNDLIPALKGAIDSFIDLNRDNIDLSRIYVGGFSMGGKMTLRLAATYPDFFAAAFPICPAFEPTKEQLAPLHGMPVWLTVSKFDVLAGYYTYSDAIWKNPVFKITFSGFLQFIIGIRSFAFDFSFIEITFVFITFLPLFF